MIETILVGDIGGTNSRLSLFHVNSEFLRRDGLQNGRIAPGNLVFQKKYQNENFENFESVIRLFFSDAKLTLYPKICCIAVAGPVKCNSVTFTNRTTWTISGDKLVNTFNMTSVKLINDFVAAGYGILTLDHGKECYTLQSAIRHADAPIACVGAGTGLGQCYLTPDSSGNYTCYASEGGHAEYAPRTELDLELLLFLKEKFCHKHRVSVERVVSGTGLANVYEFLSRKFPSDVDPEVHAMIEREGDQRGAVIASNRHNKLCQMTMDMFITAYGSEAGVACLKWIPKGGLYLAGGLTPKNLDLMSSPDGPFLTALKDKGRVSGIIDEIPIFAVKCEDLGERGAHRVAVADLLEVLRASDRHAELSAVPRDRAKGTPNSVVFAWGLCALLVVAVSALVLERKTK